MHRPDANKDADVNANTDAGVDVDEIIVLCSTKLATRDIHVRPVR